jgi:ABC-type sugar transport system permease subunit
MNAFAFALIGIIIVLFVGMMLASVVERQRLAWTAGLAATSLLFPLALWTAHTLDYCHWHPTECVAE